MDHVVHVWIHHLWSYLYRICCSDGIPTSTIVVKGPMPACKH